MRKVLASRAASVLLPCVVPIARAARDLRDPDATPCTPTGREATSAAADATDRGGEGPGTWVAEAVRQVAASTPHPTNRWAVPVTVGVTVATIASLLAATRLMSTPGPAPTRDVEAPNGAEVRQAVVIGEGERAFLCADELRALATTHPFSTARAVRVDPAVEFACGSDDGCLIQAARIVIDRAATTIAFDLGAVRASTPRAHMSSDLLMARAHEAALEMCSARDIATTLAGVVRHASQHP